MSGCRIGSTPASGLRFTDGAKPSLAIRSFDGGVMIIRRLGGVIDMVSLAIDVPFNNTTPQLGWDKILPDVRDCYIPFRLEIIRRNIAKGHHRDNQAG